MGLRQDVQKTLSLTGLSSPWNKNSYSFKLTGYNCLHASDNYKNNFNFQNQNIATAFKVDSCSLVTVESYTVALINIHTVIYSINISINSKSSQASLYTDTHIPLIVKI